MLILTQHTDKFSEPAIEVFYLAARSTQNTNNYNMHIGTFFSVPLVVSRWFLILVAFMSYLGYEEDGLRGAFAYNALLMFIYICVALHEYGHVAAGTRVGVEFEKVTLGAFGGFAQVGNGENVFSERLTNKQEFVTVIFGPLVSLVLSAGLFAYIYAFDIMASQAREAGVLNAALLQNDLTQAQLVSWVDVTLKLNDVDDYIVAMFIVNACMLVFNMLPTYPMYGGRILRCALRVFTDYGTSTKIVTFVSQLIYILLFIWGLALGSVGLIVATPIMFFACRYELYLLREQEHAEAYQNALRKAQEILKLHLGEGVESTKTIAITDTNSDTLCEIDIHVLAAAASHLGVDVDKNLVFTMPLILGRIDTDALKELREAIGESRYAQLIPFITVSRELYEKAINKLNNEKIA